MSFFERNKDMIILALTGLGLYSKTNGLNLATNTAVLLGTYSMMTANARIHALEQVNTIEQINAARAYLPIYPRFYPHNYLF